MNNKVLILGIGGQDGSYLAEILLNKGHEVHGLRRRRSKGGDKNIRHILDQIIIHNGDLSDVLSIARCVTRVKPNVIYNEADQDNVGWSYDVPNYSYDITGAAVGKVLEVIRGIDPSIRFFQPVSATMFGHSPPKQNESTPLNPQSPYACSKVFAYYLARYYRYTHKMFVSTAIMFNHDSPRRTEDYLLNKICHSALRVAKGTQDKIALGNLDLEVDIGYAAEYMQAAYNIMEIDEPRDFVIATGQPYSILKLAEYALEWAGVDPKGLVVKNPQFSRPGKQPVLIGDCFEARKAFGFNAKTDAIAMIQKIMSPYLIVSGDESCK